MKKRFKVSTWNRRHIIDYCDGASTHKDGSEFWGIEIYKNKKDLNRRIKQLIADGYVEV